MDTDVTMVPVEELGSSSGAGPSSTKKPPKRFEIKKWNAVSLWAWDIVVDNCAICRNHIMDLCIECQANQASATSEECTVAWAKATGVVLTGVFATSLLSSAIKLNYQKNKIKNGKECGVCKGKGFYKCKLCKGKSTIEWSPLYDPLVINPCLCPTCDGNKVQKCLNCLGDCYV